MSELDTFETRFAAAYRRHLDSAPRGLEAAAIVRIVTAPHPRPRWGTWPSTVRPASALAWIVLLGLLLVALGAAAIFIGSRPGPELPALIAPVGTFVCPLGSTPDEPGPVGQARPLAEKLERLAMALDRRAGRLVALTNAGDGVKTWTFDLCTNTWAQMHPNREPPGFEGQLVYDVDSDVTIGVSSGKVWAYDLQADAWTERGVAPIDAMLWAYDPVSGLVLAASNGVDPMKLWTYDVETDRWTMIQQANAGPDNAAIAYDASVDRLVAYGDGAGGSPPYETWLFDIRTGAWSRSTAERPAVGAWLVPPGIVYDEAAERTVIFRRGPKTAYDASADRWEILAEARTVAPALMAYDPVNRRLVGWGDKTWGPTGAVEALDLVTGEWTVLLAPSDGQPVPSTR